MFDLKRLKESMSEKDRYQRQIDRIKSLNQETGRIESVVSDAISNLDRDKKSFVIYGEPQSGKTEMMIALTAKLLDHGRQIVVVLMNDSVQLLGQNLERFQRSGLAPTPKKFSEMLPPEVRIRDHQWVIFCKKNSKDLQKLLDKLDGHNDRVVVDDEADYATPNSKINRSEKTKINELTEKLIGKDGVYIGVTATPARLDLNRTHKNENEHWIDLHPHKYYTGQDAFFPVNTEEAQYRLAFLPEAGDAPKFLTEALFRFMVTCAHLNTSVNLKEENYSILIHTSSKKADHSTDYKLVVKIFDALRSEESDKHEKYFKHIYDIASDLFPGEEDAIVGYIYSNCERNNIVVMNSDKEKNAADNRTATSPTTPFTVIIGGNIVSRGVTFDNLLSMFFTRDVKHKMQQDTYIQRARMFGSRGKYLKHFELTIPRNLFLDWQRCFIFHRLSLESRKQNKQVPVWLDGKRVSAVAAASIDKTSVIIDKGEMSFQLFELDEKQVNEIIKSKETGLKKLRKLEKLLGDDCLPAYVVSFIEKFMLNGESSLAVHDVGSIEGYTDKPGELDKATITRTRGFIGNRELEEWNYPGAMHHINIMKNEQGKARVFYKFVGDVRFLKTRKLK